MKTCLACRGPNSTMSGLCVACQVGAATRKAMASHEVEQRMRARGVAPIRPDLYRDPATVPVAPPAFGIGSRGRCAGCGGEVKVDHGPPWGHTLSEHDPTCDGDGERCMRLCPVPVACGPVEPDGTPRQEERHAG